MMMTRIVSLLALLLGTSVASADDLELEPINVRTRPAAKKAAKAKPKV